MSTYYFWTYFDIETLGLDPENDKVISIQFQNIVYDNEGRPIHDEQVLESIAPGLHILKEWESSEESIVKQAFIELLAPDHREYFEPVGNNLIFEGRFMKSKLLKFGIIGTNQHLAFGQLNQIDLMPIMKLVNGGDRRTAQFFGKVGENKNIPIYYRNKEYVKIESYIREEAKAFIKTMDYLMMKLPLMRREILALHS